MLIARRTSYRPGQRRAGRAAALAAKVQRRPSLTAQLRRVGLSLRALLLAAYVFSPAAIAGCGGGSNGGGAPTARVQPVYGLDFSPYVLSGKDPNLGAIIPASQTT